MPKSASKSPWSKPSKTPVRRPAPEPVKAPTVPRVPRAPIKLGMLVPDNPIAPIALVFALVCCGAAILRLMFGFDNYDLPLGSLQFALVVGGLGGAAGWFAVTNWREDTPEVERD